MYCSTSVKAQLVRGALAVTSIAGAIVLTLTFGLRQGYLVWPSILCAGVPPAGSRD